MPKDIESGEVSQSDLGSLVFQCSNAEAKLLLLLSLKANWDREPLGVVDANIRAIALVWMGTSPGAVRRCLKKLDALGLIDYVYRPAPGGSAIRVNRRFMVDHGDPYMDHSDPDHGDPPRDQGDPVVDHGDPSPPALPVPSQPPLPPPLSSPHTPLLSLPPSPPSPPLPFPPSSSTHASNGNGNGKRRFLKPKVIWDVENNKLKAIDEKWKYEFRAAWTEKLTEPVYLNQMNKATAWLQGHPERRGPAARLDRFLLNWMVNCL